MMITPSKLLLKALHANPVDPSIPPTIIDTLLLNLLIKIPARGAGIRYATYGEWTDVSETCGHDII